MPSGAGLLRWLAAGDCECTGRYCASLSSIPGWRSSGTTVSGLSTSARLGPGALWACIAALPELPPIPESAAARAAAFTWPCACCGCSFLQWAGDVRVWLHACVAAAAWHALSCVVVEELSYSRVLHAPWIASVAS